MINYNKNRATAIVYPSAVCNLNCRYCTIDKNPALLQIDKELEKSFEGDYYFNRIKEYFPRRDSLKYLETWGGEPFLHMDRIYPLVHQLIDYYPYFYHMYSSTNFSFPEWIDQFMGLMNCFADYPYRQFEYLLQLSVDGPEEINDANRGKGVTQKCIQNFDKLVQLIKDDKFPSNVKLTVTIKGTWDIDTFHKLNSKEKLIQFFQFYEKSYLNKLFDLNKKNIIIRCNCPNVAEPSPITKHDGKIFANIAKLCREIEQENTTLHYFSHYTNITPFNGQNCFRCDFYGERTCCGTGDSMVGFLPYNRISVCHEGFTLLLDEYKKYATKRSSKDVTVIFNDFLDNHSASMCLTDDEYIEYERKMSFIQTYSTVQFTNATTLIIALAMAGLVDKKYSNIKDALLAAKYIIYNTGYCVKANQFVTGSFALQDTSDFILLLNGALDYIMQQGELK